MDWPTNALVCGNHAKGAFINDVIHQGGESGVYSCGMTCVKSLGVAVDGGDGVKYEYSFFGNILKY